MYVEILQPTIEKITILDGAQYINTLASLILNAKQRIWLSSFVMAVNPKKNGRPITLIFEYLKQKVLEGVEVRLLLNCDSLTSSRGTLSTRSRLLCEEIGIKTLAFPAGRTLHAKIVVVDKNHCIIGSSNLTERAAVKNSELNIYIKSESANHNIAKYYSGLWAEATNPYAFKRIA